MTPSRSSLVESEPTDRGEDISIAESGYSESVLSIFVLDRDD